MDADNIIKPNLEELPTEHRQAHEEYKKAREVKELHEFLGKFKKDHQGNITPLGEIKFPPLQAEQVKPSVSTTFSPEQWAKTESHIADGNNMLYQTFLENTTAQKNMPQSSAPVGEHSRILNFSTHHQDQSMESSSNEGEGSVSTYPCRSRAEAFKRTGLMESYSS